MLIQVEGDLPVVLRGVRRAVALEARLESRGVTSAEALLAEQQLARVVAQYDLHEDLLFVENHTRGCRAIGECLVVCGSHVPWWRGGLAFVAAQHFGFQHDGGLRSWPWLVDTRVSALHLYGTRQAVLNARMLYATAELIVAGQAHRAPRGCGDEFLAGIAIGISVDLLDMRASANKRLRAQVRGAMVIYDHTVVASIATVGSAPNPLVVKPGASALDDYFASAVQEPEHPLVRGIVLAQSQRLAARTLQRQDVFA